MDKLLERHKTTKGFQEEIGNNIHISITFIFS